MEKQDLPVQPPTTTGGEPIEPEATEAPLTAKRELKKILREDSNWSIRSISITALTGVSVAVISTQLNGLVSSMVLIAIMAFITASVSEIYRVFLALTGFGARRAAKALPKVVQTPGRAEDPPAIVEAPAIERPITEALDVVTSAYRLSDEQEARHPGILRRVGYRLKNYGKANPFLWLIVLFLGIAITTVSVAYLVTDGKPPQIVQRTVVSTQELSQEDRASIVEEAKAQALEQLRSEQAEQSSRQVDWGSVNSLGSQLSTLEGELDELRSSTAAPTPSPSDPVVSDQPMLDRISALETERTQLLERIAKLEAAQSGSTGSGTTGGTGSTPAPQVPSR